MLLTQVGSAHAAGTSRPLVVMTRNLDAGSDFGLIFAATNPTDFLTAAAATWQEIQDSNIPERMAGIAAEIAATEPDVVSLQEATLYRTGPLSFTGIPAATNVAYDQLGLLRSALAADGAHYTLLRSLAEFDAEAPDTTLGYDVRITDYDAMLVRSNEPSHLNFKVGNPQAAHCSTIAYAPTPFGSIPVYHGWMSADITILGTRSA